MSTVEEGENMYEESKRTMILKYFQPFPDWAFLAVLLGVSLLFLWILSFGEADEMTTLLGVFGLIAAIAGVVLIYSHLKGQPSDYQVDKWLEEDLKYLSRRAVDKCGADDSELIAEPVTITGPYIWYTGDAKVLFKKGKDNILRFTPIRVVVVNFTQKQLLIYSCVYDLIDGKLLNESTDEYFFKDVVSVSTRLESMSITIPESVYKLLARQSWKQSWKLGNSLRGRATSGTNTIQLNNVETFTLTTTGGTSISIVLRDPDLTKIMGGGVIPTTRAEKAVQVIRKMILENK